VALRALPLRRAEGEVFAYFNNDWEGFAVRNAQALKKMLDAPLRVSETSRT
jgi:uncharacterized protein YecE (DUF72 family)